MMQLRGLATVMALFLTSHLHAAPLPKDPAKGMPHLVWQIKPIDGIREDYQHLHGKLKGVGGFPDWETIEQFAATVFPGWRNAVDASKPLGGYLTVNNDLEKSRPVLLFPIKDQATFVELVKHLCPDLAEVEDKRGLYRGSFTFFRSKIPVEFCFKDNYAHLCIDGGELLDDITKLPGAADLLLKDESALIAIRFYLEGVPEEAKKVVRKGLEDLSIQGNVGMMEMMLMGMIGAADVKDFTNRIRRAVDEAKWASLRIELDRNEETLALEFNLVPRKESALGKEIAAFKPKPSRFSALLDDQTAAGILLSYGNFGGLKVDPELVDAFSKNVLESAGLAGGGDVAHRLLVKALTNSIRVNEVDGAVALKKAPGKDTYTLVVGAKLNQPKLLAAAMVGYLQTLPKEKRECFKFAVMKLDGDIAVHQLKLTDLAAQAKEIFGETDVYFCHKDDIMFAAMGTGAVDRLKECLKLEPKEGPQFLIEVNHAKLTSLIGSIDQTSANNWHKFFPKEERMKMLHGKVEGGDVLRVRYMTDIIPLIKMMHGMR